MSKELTPAEIQDKFAAPFTKVLQDGSEVPDLKWRVLTTFQDKEGNNYAEYTAYITAPQGRERLNEVVGIFGWESSFEEMASEKGMICNLSVQGNSKSGIGSMHKAPDDVDKDKTKESDSFKRACLGFGIGAYIKNMKPVVLKVKKQAGKVAFAYSSDGKTELHTNDQINAYLNSVNNHLINLSNAIKTLDKDIQEANRKEIECVWKLFR